MSLPTAIATGAAADTSTAVRPVRAGAIAGLLVAAVVFVVYLATPVPDRIARLLGADTTELAHRGGLRLTWVPPASLDAQQRAKLDTSARKDGDAYVIEVPGVAEGDVDAVAHELVDGEPLVFRRVIRTPAMQALVVKLQLPMDDTVPGIEIDQWRPEDGGAVRTDYYLIGHTRAELDGLLARARGAGWTLPAGLRIGYEAIEARTGTVWRTYVVRDVVELGGEDIASAVTAYDPNTGRPTILLDFTRASAARLGDLTAEIAGEKLATMRGDLVISAPIINGPIRGGRAAITMGGTDPRKQERDARILAGALSAHRALAAGGTLRAASYVSPTNATLVGWAARTLLAAIAGLLVGLAAWAVVRRARPVRHPLAAVAPGGVPWARIAVTLLAPLAVVGLAHVPVLGFELADPAPGVAVTDIANLGMLGLAPVTAGYVLVEVLALLVPGWRCRRHAGEAARRPFATLVPAVVLVLAAVQAWMIAGNLHVAFDGGVPLEDMFYPPLGDGSIAAGPFIASVLFGVLAFVGVAEAIRRWGLGNGYGALFVAGWIVAVVRRQLHPGDADAAVRALAVIVPLVTITVGVALARWRVARVGELALRVPASGVAPVSPGGGIVVLLGLAALLAPGPVAIALSRWTMRVLAEPSLLLALVAVSAIGWSAAFARGRRLRRVAERAGLAGASAATWREATLLTVAALLGLALLVRFTAPSLGALPLAIVDGLFTAAVLVDVVHDLRGRRVPRVRVWALHQAQLADPVERALAAADIPCHLVGGHLRAMLAFFGPFAPIDVYVRPEDAVRAHAVLTELLPIE